VRILITGGRRYSDGAQFNRVMAKRVSLDDELCHGGATGADLMCAVWATAHEVDCRRMPAQWKRFDGDRSEGYRRNRRMLLKFKPELVIAFPGGTGTANMVNIARRAQVRVIIIKPKMKKETPNVG